MFVCAFLAPLHRKIASNMLTTSHAYPGELD